MTPLEITIRKMETVSGNVTRREHWSGEVKRAKNHRHATSFSLLAEDMFRAKTNPADEWQGALSHGTGAPVIVTITRCCMGKLDAHDNLRTALKHVVDGVADFLGCDDDDERITWRYAQEKTKRGVHEVKIKIEVRPL